MRKKIIGILTLTIGSLGVFAQNSSITIGQGQETVTAMYFEGGIAASEIFSPRYARSQGIIVQGTPFLTEAFENGKIVIQNKVDLLLDEQILKCKLRFNVYDNEFEFINKHDTLLVTNTKLIKTISIGKNDYIFTLCSPQKSLIESAYMIVLVDGNTKLLKRYVCEIERNLSVPHYMGGNGDGSYYYKIESELYSKNGIQNAVKLPYNIKTVTKLFGENSKQSMAFIKEQKLKIRKNEEDMIRLFEFANNL